MKTRREVMTGGITAVAAMACPAFGWGQSWPSRPIRMVVPLAAGGGVDLMARTLAEYLGQQIGARIVVENQGGGGGTIAAASVARSDPDGYTFIFQSVSSAVVNALVYKKLNYDPINDFMPVTLFGVFPLVAIINPQVPAKDLPEFIALLKANPGKYSYGSSGVGTSIHLAGELFKTLAGVDMVHVPYRGNSAATTDLLGGRIALMFDGVAPQLGNIETGAVRALGVTTTERSKVLPKVPAMREFVPGYEMPFWTALFAPAKTPKDIVDRVSAGAIKAAQNPDVVKRLGELGVDPTASTPDELDRFWHQQLDYYRKIVEATNISIAQ